MPIFGAGEGEDMPGKTQEDRRATHQAVSFDARFPIALNAYRQDEGMEAIARPHFHSCMELLLAQGKTVSFTVGGQSVHLQGGDVLIIYPHVTHAYGSALSESPEKDSGAEELCSFFIDADRLLAYTEAFPADWQPSAAKQTMLPDRRESTIEIKPALNYIRWNYAEHIYVDMLCELCHMSPANFRRKFKEAMGVTPLDYIHEVRIEKACAMLRTGNQSILDISAAVGFESISSFNRQFMTIMGVSPNQYRNTK